MHSTPKTMDKILIYPPQGDKPIIEAPLNSGARIVCKLMGEYYIELQFSHTSTLPLVRGSYITYNDRIYYLRRDAAPKSLLNADGYRYTLKFYGQQHLMEDCVFRWLTGGNKEITFSLTTNLDTFASLLAENMTAYMGNAYDILWTYTAVSEDISAQTKGLSFDGVSCWQAMDDIANAFGVEWYVREVVSGNKRALAICFGKVDTGEYIAIREGEIVIRYPEARRGEDENYGTRFYVYGGTKNIPEDYYESVVGGTTNHISEKRLHLPNGQEYIDAVPNLSPTQIIEKKIVLDDIFPENTETITDIKSIERETIEGEKNIAYIMVCTNSNFDPETMKIGTIGATFTSGALKGRSFDLGLGSWVSGKEFNGEFEIIAQVDGGSGSSQVIIPNEFVKPVVGDTFVLTGVKLPTANVREAENRLLNKGLDLVKQYYADTNIYDCPTNHVYCFNNNISFPLGQRVKLIGSHFGSNGRMSRVQGYEKSLYAEYKATYNIGDNTSYSKTLSAIHKIDNVLSKEIGDANSKVGHSESKIQIIYLDNKNNKDHIDKISNDREHYITEYESFYADSISLDKEYGNFVAVYQVLRDANGDELRDADGKLLRVRIPLMEYTVFKQSAKAYEEELQAVIQSTGIVETSEAYSIARDAYYEARAKLMTMITDGTKERIDNVDERVTDLDYLRQTFGEDNVSDSNGVTLSRMVSVKDENSNVVAGLYGGGVDALNDNFEDAEHGTLMFFAGANSVQEAKEAKHRVYEDGTVYIKEGVFEGVIQHRVVKITKANIDTILPSAGTSIDGNTTYTITPMMMSAIMDFTNQNVTLKFTDSDRIAFMLPVLYNYTLYGANGITSKDELRGLVGTRFIVYNNTPAAITFCGRRYDPESNSFDSAEVCYADWAMGLGQFAIVECRMSMDSAGREVIYWDINVGRHTMIASPIDE